MIFLVLTHFFSAVLSQSTFETSVSINLQSSKAYKRMRGLHLQSSDNLQEESHFPSGNPSIFSQKLHKRWFLWSTLVLGHSYPVRVKCRDKIHPWKRRIEYKDRFESLRVFQRSCSYQFPASSTLFLYYLLSSFL